MALAQTLRSERLLRLLPIVSALCVLVGFSWLLLLSNPDNVRNTYVSENALLPGGVHTYFSGSEQNVFRAYRSEVKALGVNASSTTTNGKESSAMTSLVGDIFRGQGLKVGTQRYTYSAGGRTFSGENVYAVLEAPRGDATESIVLCAGWTNMDGVLNESGVALILALARYLKRWSLWSKDIVFLIASDSRAGAQAWVDAYHDMHTPGIASLPIKSGAIQGVVVVDYPHSHSFESVHIIYDGINGQLPNLDLINTAVKISEEQMGMQVDIQEMWRHGSGGRGYDQYDGLRTMLRGMVNQGLGHATGPHSSFIPYHIDAIMLQVRGEGRHDEVSLGRTVESLTRSLNNLLEHFHQSFFFYLLLAPRKFVSIGTYLPSAMLVAVGFTFTAIGLWIKSGQGASASEKPLSEKSEETEQTDKLLSGKGPSGSPDSEKPSSPEKSEETEQREQVPSKRATPADNASRRDLFLPIAFVTAVHFLGFVPLYLFNNINHAHYTSTFYTFTILSLALPPTLSALLTLLNATPQTFQLIKCFSLLLLGLFLSALATLNFSLSFLIGIFSTPFLWSPTPSGATYTKRDKITAALLAPVMVVLGPTTALAGVAVYWGEDVAEILSEAAFGWHVWGMWTQVVVWGVWWPAWMLAGALVVAAWVPGGRRGLE